MDKIMKQLRGIETEVKKLQRKRDVDLEKLTLVIEADPSHPPYSLLSLAQSIMTREDIHATVTVHEHSSLKSACPKELLKWHGLRIPNRNRIDNQLNLTWIWKPVGRHPIAKLVNCVSSDVRGETTIARLLARLFESWTGWALYENFDLNTSASIDQWLDAWESCKPAEIPGFLKLIDVRLAKANWLAGPSTGVKSLADVFISAVLGNKLKSVRAKEWLLQCTLV